MRKKSLIKVSISILILAFSAGGLWADERSDWRDRTEINDGINLIYLAQDTENDYGLSRGDQGIIRVRAGIGTRINDQLTVGIGWATSGVTSRSSNRTMDTFDTKGWNIEYDYAQYMHNLMTPFNARRFRPSLWQTKDLFRNRDVISEGIAAEIKFRPFEDIDLEFFTSPAYFLLEGFNGSKNNPTMVVFQPGIIWKIDKTASLKFAFTYYAFDNVMGGALDWSRDTSSTPEGLSIYDSDSIAIDTEMGYYLSEMANNKITDMIPYAAVFGHFISSDAYNDDREILLGLRFGDETVSERGQWQFMYNYRRLESEGLSYFLPDNNFYLGNTSFQGSEYELKVGVRNNITVGLDYYYRKPLDRDPGQTRHLLQADLVFKF